MQHLRTVARGRQVGGGVEETAVALLHDHRHRVAVAVAHLLEEYHARALALGEQAALIELRDHHGQFVVVGALGLDVGVRQRDVQLAVDLLAVRHRDVDEALPQAPAVRIARLQAHHVVARAAGEGGVGVEALLGVAVEALEVGERGIVDRLARGHHVLEVRDQHAELRAPVADVVLADHALAAKFERANHGIADDRAAQVPDVHFLGEVGRGVIHHYGLRLFARRDAEPRIGRGGLHARGEEGRREVDVDEAGAGDLEPLDHAGTVEGRDDAPGELARIRSHALRRAHRAVGLVVAELGARALGQQRLAVRGNADGAHGRFDGCVQVVAKVHGRRLPGMRTRRAIVAAGGRRAKGAPDARCRLPTVASHASVIHPATAPVSQATITPRLRS